MDVLEEVRTRRLVIVDATGRERIVAEADWEDGSCSLMIMGKKGSSACIVAEIGADEQPQISIGSRSGLHVVFLQVQKDGKPFLAVHEPPGVPLLRISKYDESTPTTVEIFKDGKVAVRIPNSEE